MNGRTGPLRKQRGRRGGPGALDRPDRACPRRKAARRRPGHRPRNTPRLWQLTASHQGNMPGFRRLFSAARPARCLLPSQRCTPRGIDSPLVPSRAVWAPLARLHLIHFPESRSLMPSLILVVLAIGDPPACLAGPYQSTAARTGNVLRLDRSCPALLLCSMSPGRVAASYTREAVGLGGVGRRLTCSIGGGIVNHCLRNPGGMGVYVVGERQ